MIISEQWLREWIDLPLSSEQLAERMTMAGLEVDSVTRAGPMLPKVVAGRVRTLRRHPRAQRLQVCEVDIGNKRPLQVVCGAPNVTQGGVYPTALAGAKLPGGDRRGCRRYVSAG